MHASRTMPDIGRKISRHRKWSVLTARKCSNGLKKKTLDLTTRWTRWLCEDRTWMKKRRQALSIADSGLNAYKTMGLINIINGINEQLEQKTYAYLYLLKNLAVTYIYFWILHKIPVLHTHNCEVYCHSILFLCG